MIVLLMITQPGREAFAEKAKADFHAQTMPDTELVVVHDPKDGTPLGELRNQAVDMAKGEFIAIWDDDDRYNPHRLAEQMAAIDGYDAVFLSRVTIKCTCGWEGPSMERRWECTMVARREAMPMYPPLECAEDNALVTEMEGKCRLVNMLAPWLYVKNAHDSNTMSHRLILKRSGHRCSEAK